MFEIFDTIPFHRVILCFAKPQPHIFGLFLFDKETHRHFGFEVVITKFFAPSDKAFLFGKVQFDIYNLLQLPSYNGKAYADNNIAYKAYVGRERYIKPK